jgi:hypothetical protein
VHGDLRAQRGAYERRNLARGGGRWRTGTCGGQLTSGGGDGANG